jgi:hypothetical protein
MAVYKPTAGERPLWDFEQSSLCKREVASYLLSQALGWPAIPPTVLRDGVHGPGSVQLYIDAYHEEHYLSLRENDAYIKAWKEIVLFDVITNNADRKAGHCLLAKDGKIWAIDHGLTFHQDEKLRTVIWEYAGQPISLQYLEDLDNLFKALEPGNKLHTTLAKLLSENEINSLQNRLQAILKSCTFPMPHSGVNVPFPMV